MSIIKAKFWTFGQNNSGGSFDYDEERGITHYVIVEAVDEAHAISRAENIGLYWNGCEIGMDCDCCGDRWHTPYDDGEDVPKVYDQDIRKEGGYKPLFGRGWMKEGREIAVHPINGPVEWFGAVNDPL